MISIDVGYGNIKAAEGDHLWAFPAIYTSVHTGHVPPQGAHAQLIDLGAEGKYFVGRYALKLGGEAPFNKTELFRHKLFVLAALCEGTKGNWEGDIGVGLPIGDYDLMATSLQSLVGEHSVVYNDVARTIKIDSVKVYAQAEAVYSYLRQRDSSLDNKIVGIVDIGQKTVDAAYFTDEAYLTNKSASFEGISTIDAYRKIAQAVGRKCGFFVEDFAVRRYLTEPKVKEDVEEAFAEMARGILNRLSRLGWDFRQMDAVALIGGGSGYVVKAFQNAGANLIHLEEMDAVFANAKAFLL